MALHQLVRSIRPAPLGAATARLLGLTKRRVLETQQGIFYVNPCTRLGTDLLTGVYEPEMVQVLHRHLHAGATFIDLGANEGYFTVIGSKLVGPGGSVIAIEPQSRLQPIIQENLYLNSCFNVRVLRTVIAERTGEFSLSLTSDLNTGGSSIANGRPVRARTETIRGVSLADFLTKAAISHCDLMKVDIEGAEYDVFMNAGDVLRQHTIRRIALEIHNSTLERRGLSGQDLHRFILDCGYALDDSLGTWVYTANSERKCND
ncbi:MAG: FkbM family methyltransferase [Acidobacteriaceae bacterium]|nr:FkbM family methyltransferase [Acidobacteriaceae bacterium]